MDLTLGSVYRILLKRIWILIIATLVGALLVFSYTFFMVDPLYTSSAKLYVYNPSNTGDVTSTNLNMAKSLVNTYLEILKSTSVAQPVVDKLTEDYPELTRSAVLKSLSGAALNDTEAFSISVTTTDPELSYDIISAVVEEYPGIIVETVKAGKVEVFEQPEMPTTYKYPIARNTVIGALMGLVISAGLCIFFAVIDTFIYTRDDITESFDLPVIGAIPMMQDSAALAKERGKRTAIDILFGRKVRGDGRSTETEKKMILNANTPFNITEAYKMARTNILYFPSKGVSPKIAFTSSFSMEGKTISAINLSVAMAQNGKKVLLIDADMRKPRVAKNLGLKSESGLSEFLAKITDTVNINSTSTENLYVISSGKASSNAAELLASPRMAQLLEQVEKSFDYIFIDTPPMNLVTDASVIAGLVDGYIVVAFSGYTDKGGVSDTIETIKQVNGNVLGFVLNGINPKNDSYGRYGKYGKYGKYSYKYGGKYSYKYSSYGTDREYSETDK